MPATITTKLITSKDIKKGYQINNLSLNEVLNLSWVIEDHRYGQPLDYTLFTMKKGNKVIGGAVVEHLKAVEDYHDPGVVLMEDLHYMLSNWTIIKEYRNKGYAEQLIKKVLEVIKDPIGVLTDYKSECDFYYLNGGNPLYSLEDLYEGASYFLFNVNVETGKKLSLQFASKRDNGDGVLYIDSLWKFNSKPHTLELLTAEIWDSDDEEEENETDDLESDIRNVTLNSNSNMYSTLFKCPKCEKKQCTYMEIQTRSADDAPECVVTCLPCGFHWTQHHK